MGQKNGNPVVILGAGIPGRNPGRVPCLYKKLRIRLAIVLAVASLLAATGCGRKRVAALSPDHPLPVRGDVQLGECAEPGKEGVMSEQPTPWRADRDLDGDGADEVVVADRSLCTREGNCHWNIYSLQDGCHRYLGTISASNIQRIRPRSETGYYGVRGFWRLTGGGRVLLQEYRFRRGGYELVEAILCRMADDDRILCEQSGR